MKRRTASQFTIMVFLLMTMVLTLAGASEANDKKSDTDEALADVTPEQVGEQAAALLSQLETIIHESRVYNDRLLTASAEDSLVLQLQIDTRQDRFMETLHQIAEITNKGEGTGASDQLLDRARIVFSEVTPEIWDLIAGIRTKIDILRSQRPGTSPADLSVLEDNILRLNTRLDRFFEFGWEHILKLESLGLDAAADRIIYNEFLSTRADELSGRLELALLRITEIKARLQETPDNTDLTALWKAHSKSLESNATSQAVILDLMDGCNLPTEQHRIQLVSTTQNLAGGLLDLRVASSIVKRSWAGITTWLVEKGPTLLFKLVIFLVIIVAGRFLARLVRKAVEKSFNKANINLSQLLRRMIVNAAHNTVLGLALLIALSQLGFSLGPLLAGFGVVGFILGFAMQDSLSNLAAGMMILVNRPYDVGDLVEISGVFGKVEQMSMVSTSILTLDNQKLIVPNSRIWGDVIKNVTDQHVRRVDMVFGISYSDDIPNAERVLNEILASNDLVLDEPEAMVRVHALGESSVDFVVRPWVKTADYWDTHWAVTKAVKMRFDAEGISIPFPQRDVHVFETQPVAQSKPVLEGPDPTTTVTHDPDEIADNEG